MIQNEKDAFFAQYAHNTDNAVLEILWQAKETRATRLDLGNCGLTELPDALFELTWLEELILSNKWTEYSFEKEKWEDCCSQNEGEANNIKFILSKINLLRGLKKLIICGKYDTKWVLSDLSPLKELMALQCLDVSSTQVSDLSPLKDLTALKLLIVTSPQLCDLSPLKDLTALQILIVSETQVSDLSPLKDLTALQQLYVFETQVSDLTPLKDLTALQILIVSETQVSDLTPLKDLMSLQILAVSSTRVGDLTPLKDLKALQELDVSETQVSDLTPLKDLMSLQTLAVWSTRVGDLTPLKDLKALQELDVKYNKKVSDLAPLKNLTALRVLSVESTQVSDLAPLKDLMALQKLVVYSTQVNDLSPLKDLTALQILYVSSTQVSDLSPLKDLTALKWLWISDTQVSNLSPLKDSTALIQLWIQNTKVSDLTPLTNLTALKELDLHSTQVSDLSPLKDLTALQKLDLHSTQVSDLTPLKDLTALQQLNLHSTQVSDLTPLKDLTALQKLEVYSTQVSDLAPLKDLTALQKLEVYSTQVSDLAPLKDLTALQKLDVHSTQVSDLTPLKNLTALQELDVHSTQVSDLTPLKDLTALQKLDVSSIQVNDLTPLKDLTALQILYVSLTQVSDLTPLKNLTALVQLLVLNTNVNDLSPLKDLIALYLLNVSLTQVSDLTPLKGLMSLKNLDVSLTQVSDLTPLKDLTSLKSLSVIGCPIQYIPKEIYHHGDCAKNLYAYWQDLKQSQTTQNNQLKIMFLGNGCVGKTTLLHWFLDNAFKDLSLEDGRTEGIIIQPYTFKYSDVLAHFWDFGGQEVYHATHRLFLGRRSLYLLVWATESPDAAQEERHPPQYWLDMIADIGGNERSRVLIVQNLFDGQTERNILSDAERQDYEKRGLDITTYCINAKTGLKIKSLKSAIEEEAEQLLKTNIEELPTSWVNIRKAVADKRLAKDKTLARAAFENICRDCELTTDPNVILGYLHRAGELFHYDNQFDNQIILDQEWALKAVYAVLKRDRIERYKGVFTLHDLREFWQKDNPNLTDDEAKIFLNFMLENQTMFYTEGAYKERGDNPEFVVPQLLPTTEPNRYRTWQRITDKTRHRIQYAFLHRDIIERFIVATAHLSKNKDYWRNGLFIEYAQDEAMIEVVNDAQDDKIKYIHIECTGTTQTELLKKIREEFNKIRSLDKAKEYRFTNGDWVQVKGEMSFRAEDMGGFKEKAPIFDINKKSPISLQLTTENSMKQYLLDLLSEGKLKEVFAEIKKIADTQSSYFTDPLVLLQSRFNRNERENESGLSDSREYKIERNRIENSVKSLIDSEFDESKAPAPPKNAPKEENKQSNTQTSNSERDNKETTSGKLKILMMTANPSTQTELDLDAEHSSIVQKLQNKQEQFSFKIYKGVSKSGFKEITETNKPDILHFSGHGQNGKYGGLIVQKTDGSEDLIPPKGLSAVFKYFKSEDIFIKATILNACYSEEQAQAICNHIPYVIGTTLNISDKLAIAFSIGFYFKLAETGSIEKAFLSGVAQASMDGADESDFVIYKDGNKLEL